MVKRINLCFFVLCYYETFQLWFKTESIRGYFREWLNLSDFLELFAFYCFNRLILQTFLLMQRDLLAHTISHFFFLFDLLDDIFLYFWWTVNSLFLFLTYRIQFYQSTYRRAYFGIILKLVLLHNFNIRVLQKRFIVFDQINCRALVLHFSISESCLLQSDMLRIVQPI